NPDVQASFLGSPLLVVAYALAGTMNIDLTSEPLAFNPNGVPVYLKDVWPSSQEIQQAIHENLDAEMFAREYSNVLDGNETWNDVSVPKGDQYSWDEESDYIREPPFFQDITLDVPSIEEITGARALAWLPDSTTTDHISPAGNIAVDSPAGRFLISRGVQPNDFNSYGSRRGNHEVMMRGTLANIRIKNKLVPGVEGGYTIYQPDNEQLAIWDAAVKYMENNIPLIILAGKEYGSGSSRDWAAKGVYLQGVKAVIAESYERIHRSNLVGMGILPLQFKPGESVEQLGLTGFETYDIIGLDNNMTPGMDVVVRATDNSGNAKKFTVISRIDSPVEVEYYRNGGILQTVLRQTMKKE
ncbi:aconitate hydratase, partial [candidate division KSB1 bacterium]|nr:aconitate hydratase [candidate division KSB1 bacterium]